MKCKIDPPPFCGGEGGGAELKATTRAIFFSLPITVADQKITVLLENIKITHNKIWKI